MKDSREERGRLLALGGRVKHVEGEMWFVPSQQAGGHIVNVATAACSCPDFRQNPVRCKHLWAVEFSRSALTQGGSAPATAEPAPGPPPPKGDLTAEEQRHVRTAMRFLRTRRGGWEAVAKATRFKRKSLENAAYGGLVSGSLTIRLARCAGVPVDDLLTGRYPPTCPHCGQRMETGNLEGDRAKVSNLPPGPPTKEGQPCEE